MPIYEYVCQDCGAQHEVRASVAEYSEGLEPRCPNCGSPRQVRRFSPFNVGHGRNVAGPGCGPDAGSGCCGS